MKVLKHYFFILIFIALACEDKIPSTTLTTDSTKLLDKIMQGDNILFDFSYNDKNLLIQMDKYFDDTIYTSYYFSYDSLNRISEKKYYGYTEKYQYNNDGKLSEMKRYYPYTNKTWKTIYTYKDGRIASGENYFNGNPSSFLKFTYDANGNTTERKEYFYGDYIPGDEEQIIKQQKFQYDNKINPIPAYCMNDAAVVQKNNPVYSYLYDIVMSSFPPEFNISYIYDSLNLPLMQTSNNISYSSSSTQTVIYDYVYREINK